mmetsp:Transcript_22132/g.36184  ORF Transcript_22132/g.36184 Transcript_22132/m.36184 type:complete len:321 (+) Transcript_22132:70-1032(+)
MSFNTKSSAAATLKPCVICKGESCFVIPGIASSQCFCLLHYYTTGKHNDYGPTKNNKQAGQKKNKKTSLLVEYERMKKQLPAVQELFAEAFVELRTDIGEASARAFQQTKHNADDPLASLLTDAPSSFQSMPSQVRKYNFPRSNSKRKSPEYSKRAAKSNDTEGGFIREAILPEKLRRLQNPDINLGNIPSKTPVPTQHRSETDTMNNPYRKRKKTSSIWHQILDSNDATSKGNNNSDDRKPKAKRNWDEMEKEMIDSFNTNAASKHCTSCKSANIEIVGNSTSRNSDMTKGEVWGMKDRGETVVERCRCLNCGRIWNED